MPGRWSWARISSVVIVESSLELSGSESEAHAGAPRSCSTAAGDTIPDFAMDVGAGGALLAAGPMSATDVREAARLGLMRFG